MAGALRQALQRALTDRGTWDTLRVLVEFRRHAELRSVRLFGNGIGVWNDERQFRLDDDRIAALLRALRDADFPGLEDTYGGPARRPPQPPAGDPPPGDDRLVTLITCRIELALGGYEKHVVQLDKGEQSPVLKRLAEDILEICEPPGRSGLAAESLRDGMEKLSRGELGPETWVIALHRRPDKRSAGQGEPGFLLTILGSEARVRAYRPEGSTGEQIVLRLSPGDVQTLARELAARDPAAWPVNLYARDYTDLSLQVLSHKKSIQARQFDGMGPVTHGAHQEAFEEVFAILDRLHRKVVGEGHRVTAP